MYTTDALRERYARTSDNDLLALLDVGPERLTPESRQALFDEAMRRGLKVPEGWPPMAAPLGTYAPPGARRYVKANFGARFLAYLIDLGVSIVPVTAISIFVGVSGMVNRQMAVSVIAIVASACWAVWYTFTKDGREGGQSIGKDMMDLMVVHTETNQPCTMGQSAIRALIWCVVNLVPVVGWLIEPIMAIADENGRRLGDRAAGTQVIPVSSYVPTVL
jgi:uncharacterized RDD family membrane protein YckC